MAKMPDDIQFLGVIEPLGDLFKDEVREVGEKLGIPHELVWASAVPGPGLGVRYWQNHRGKGQDSAGSRLGTA